VVVEGVGEGTDESDALIELAEGSSPASLESWPSDGSITSGVPKKLRICGQAAGILSGGF
jgi:hypothetical protein